MESGRGRKEHQKMKPYLVYQYLLRNSDENHVVTAPELVGLSPRDRDLCRT